MRRLLVAALFASVAGGSALAQDFGIRNMWTGPVVLPHTEAPRTPPEGSMATDGDRRLNRRQARDIPNPVPETAAAVAQGETLYHAYCTVCHGAAGWGDGPLASFYRRMPDLTMRHVLNYPDGFVYTIIREGGRNMPRFADALSVDERWALVHFLGTLEPAPGAAQ